MERKKILLILSVMFLWVSLAEDVPGFFRDKSVPSKLGLRGLWKKHKPREQHESEDTRATNKKETKESSDIEFRHTLPIKDTTGFLPENDVSFTGYCHSIVIRKELPDFNDRGYLYTPTMKYYETICDPPEDNSVMINQVAHQRCFDTQYYCFTREEEVKIVYASFGRRGVKLQHKVEKMGTGCVCGTPNVGRKR